MTLIIEWDELSLEVLGEIKDKANEEIKKRKKVKTDVPMDLKEFVEWTKKSKQRHIQLIGSWAETIQVKFKTKSQWDVFIKRNLRAARLLEPFSDQQIIDAFADIEKSSTWLQKFTLETILKFLK